MGKVHVPVIILYFCVHVAVQICVYRVDDGSHVRTLRAHQDTVDALASVGTQVRHLCEVDNSSASLVKREAWAA